jgi:hypothetical protein
MRCHQTHTFVTFTTNKQQTPWSKVILEKLIVAQLLKKFSTFLEPDGSLPCSQEPATGSYPEPDESSPQLSNPFICDPLYYYPFTLSGFPTKILYLFPS